MPKPNHKKNRTNNSKARDKKLESQYEYLLRKTNPKLRGEGHLSLQDYGKHIARVARSNKEQSGHVNLHHARTPFQRDVMKRIEKDGVCPFCMTHFLKYHTKPILSRGRYWVFTENFEPYEGSAAHFIAVYRTHVVDIRALMPSALRELFAGFNKLVGTHKLKGATMFIRFGDTNYTGATVAHLHAHLVSGASRKKSAEPLYTRIGYKRKFQK